MSRLSLTVEALVTFSRRAQAQFARPRAPGGARLVTSEARDGLVPVEAGQGRREEAGGEAGVAAVQTPALAVSEIVIIFNSVTQYLSGREN